MGHRADHSRQVDARPDHHVSQQSYDSLWWSTFDPVFHFWSWPEAIDAGRFNTSTQNKYTAGAVWIQEATGARRFNHPNPTKTTSIT